MPSWKRCLLSADGTVFLSVVAKEIYDFNKQGELGPEEGKNGRWIMDSVGDRFIDASSRL